MIPEIKNICCIGAGYVGGPTMSVIAEKCPHIKVNVVDTNKKRIDLWNSKNLNNLPIYEPGLKSIIKKCRGKNLFFTVDTELEIKKADMIFISVNTPTKTKGLGAGQASDLKWVELCARQVAQFGTGHTIVVEKSTLPVKTAEVIKSILENSNTENTNNIKSTFHVLSNPEFLAEGSAINDLKNPDRVLIGGDNNGAIMALNSIYSYWVPKEKILHTNIWSSELAKLTANAFLAQRISSINSIAAICEVTGADISEVSRAIGSDTRIGSKFLDSGPGFGGSCFKKDILNLVYLCKYYDLHEVGRFWESVVELNSWNQNRISNLIIKKLFGTVNGKKIYIMGFAFKANTNDTRESAAIKICKDLLNEGALLYINDPKVIPAQISEVLGMNESNKKEITEKKDLENEGKWHFIKNVVDGFHDADAAVILTEWEQYGKINWEIASKLMRKPSWVFDTRSIISANDLRKYNINFWKIGDGTH